ncbi:general substrate transporter [Gilbertella persicaria]|uniref:general substrate transporter n=1 Tax=Gilbertella persicaria TaxID=101096 RepID=UPI002220755A|nr:general substrate transporter [Gilbertella persicaria]KAI8076704.1 general substrate transporter [Gilbertella persicaria]
MSSNNIAKIGSKNKPDNDKVLDPHEEVFEPHEEVSDDSEMTGKASPFVYTLVVCVCIGGFLFGYDTGVISGALTLLQQDFNMSSVQKELVVGGTTFGAIFGGFFSGIILVIASSLIFIAGALILALARNYGVLLFGRVVVGLGVGIASMIVPVYVSELSPKYMRGRLNTLNTLVLTFGQVVAYVMNIAFASVPNGWRYMFGIAGIPALFQFIIMPFLPESPRRLVAIGKMEEAKRAIRKVYGNSVTDVFIEREVKMIDNDIHTCRSGSFRDFVHRDNFMPLIIACILQAAQQLSGFNAAMYYAATILQMAGFRSNEGSTSVAIIVAGTNMVFTAVAISVIDKVGRRKMLLFTMIVMIAGLIALGATFAAQQGFVTQQSTCAGYITNCARCVLDDRCGWSISQDTCIAKTSNSLADILNTASGCPIQPRDKAITGVLLTFLIVYVASYALGLGYIPWLAQSEMFPMSIRGKANGVATAVNWICNLIVSTTFLSMTEAMTTAGTFWFYAGISIVLWAFLIRLMPETSGKTLEEIHEYFLKI